MKLRRKDIFTLIDNLKLGTNQAYFDIPSTLVPAGTTQEVDWDNGSIQIIDLGSASGDVTLTLTNGKAGGTYALKIIQGGTARDIVWPGSVLWEGSDTPVITTTNDSVDIFTLINDGANYFGTVAQDLS